MPSRPPKKSRPQGLSLTLEQDAIDSLSTAIEYYFDETKPTAWKYTIMLAGHAVEQFLKVALALHDPMLLRMDKKDGPTVGYRLALSRLVETGLVLSEEEASDLKVIRESCADLEYPEVYLTRDEVEATLARTMRFLDVFLPKVDRDIAALLPDKMRFQEFKQAIALANEWLTRAGTTRLNMATQALRRGEKVDFVSCPKCQGTVIVGVGVETPICEQCQAEFGAMEYCGTCGRAILEGIPKQNAGTCHSCREHPLLRGQ
jgi:hypothetical protein